MASEKILHYSPYALFSQTPYTSAYDAEAYDSGDHIEVTQQHVSKLGVAHVVRFAVWASLSWDKPAVLRIKDRAYNIDAPTAFRHRDRRVDQPSNQTALDTMWSVCVMGVGTPDSTLSLDVAGIAAEMMRQNDIEEASDEPCT